MEALKRYKLRLFLNKTLHFFNIKGIYDEIKCSYSPSILIKVRMDYHAVLITTRECNVPFYNN